MKSDPEGQPSPEKTALFGEDVLLRRASEGDVAAFEQLYRHHVGPVFGLCLRMVGNRDRAEELTQSAFVRAWSKLSTFRRESAFGSWLHRLAVNVVLSDLRSRSRKEDLEDELDPETASGSAIGRASGRAEEIDLEHAIARLPLRARQVFVLFEIHGYRHHEIAEFLGITEGTSKSQLSRARGLIREELQR